MLSLSLASPGGCQAVGAKMRAGTKRGSAPSSFSETQHRAAVGVSFGVRTRSVRHPRLAMGGEGGRAISRTQGTFAVVTEERSRRFPMETPREARRKDRLRRTLMARWRRARRGGIRAGQISG